MLELKESQEKTDAQILGLKEYHRQTEELLQKTIKEFRATQKLLGIWVWFRAKWRRNCFTANPSFIARHRNMLPC